MNLAAKQRGPNDENKMVMSSEVNVNTEELSLLN